MCQSRAGPRDEGRLAPSVELAQPVGEVAHASELLQRALGSESESARGGRDRPAQPAEPRVGVRRDEHEPLDAPARRGEQAGGLIRDETAVAVAAEYQRSLGAGGEQLLEMDA